MKLAKYVSKRDSVALLELIDGSLRCRNGEDYCGLLEQLQKLVAQDYDICALALKGGPGEAAAYAIVDIGRPPAWLTSYVAHAWQTTAPAHKANFVQSKLSYWADVFRKYASPEVIRSFTDNFGIVNGYVHGVRNACGNRGTILCFAGKTDKREIRRELILELALPHFHQALARVLNRDRKRPITLSKREQEVLKWVTQGKNSWDISQILNLSERTIKFHTGNIMKKLDAVNRTHAVAIAVHENLIALD
ncbi:MAG: LuxR C-terminal-related transcriptional regulator [Deltaproteobacteria bacterium]|nr:LuxR C-terminal-related transcriptional regulator [Deltaproteobacteria bacterium]